MSHMNMKSSRSVCVTEAIECGINIALLVKVKFTVYFIVSHDSNIINHCQNIYTIETKQVFTCVRYGNVLLSFLLCMFVCVCQFRITSILHTNTVYTKVKMAVLCPPPLSRSPERYLCLLKVTL